jgi:recombination protein RecA
MATKKKSKKSNRERASASTKDVFALMGKLETEQDFHSIELQTKEIADFLSTGCLSLDVSLGGGYYGGQVFQLYGAEHCGKSTLGYSTAAYLSQNGIPVAIFDHEGTTDRAYTEQPGIGLNYDLVRYFRPDTGEEAYNFMVDFCMQLPNKHSGKPQAVIFIDTIAAMTPQKWLDDPENKQPAIQGAMHSKGWARFQTLMTNKHVSVVAMNQIRSNVGNPYQSPESLPGGNAWKFATSNLVRIGRGKTEETADGEMYQLMRFKTQKNKNFIPLREAQVHLHLGYGIDPASDVCEMAKMAGYFFKRKRHKKTKKWIYATEGKGLPTLRGLDKFVPGVDGDYASLPALHEKIREQGKTGDIYRACRMAIESGEAIERYRSNTNTFVTEDEEEVEVSTISAKRTKVSAVETETDGAEFDDDDDEGGSEEADFDAEDEEEVVAAADPVDPGASEPEEDVKPAALGTRKKAAAAKKKAPARKKAAKKKATRKKATKKKAKKKVAKKKTTARKST